MGSNLWSQLQLSRIITVGFSAGWRQPLFTGSTGEMSLSRPSSSPAASPGRLTRRLAAKRCAPASFGAQTKLVSISGSASLKRAWTGVHQLEVEPPMRSQNNFNCCCRGVLSKRSWKRSCFWSSFTSQLAYFAVSQVSFYLQLSALLGENNRIKYS